MFQWLERSLRGRRKDVDKSAMREKLVPILTLKEIDEAKVRVGLEPTTSQTRSRH